MNNYKAEYRDNRETYKSIEFTAPSLRSAKTIASRRLGQNGTWREVDTNWWVKRNNHGVGHILCNYTYLNLRRQQNENEKPVC